MYVALSDFSDLPSVIQDKTIHELRSAPYNNIAL
jgi:hypothetical protein